MIELQAAVGSADHLRSRRRNVFQVLLDLCDASIGSRAMRMRSRQANNILDDPILPWK
jgi:hypothetical protein